MAEWPRNQDYNRITIATSSPESLGTELACLNVAPVSSAWTAVNFAMFFPFVVYQPFVAVKMGIVNGSVVSGNVDVGIYDDQQNRLVSTGSTAQAGTSSVQSFDITDTALRPGVYFMALAIDNVTATVMKWLAGSMYSTALGAYGQLTAFPLPTTATWISVGANGWTNMFIAGRTVV